MTVLPRSLLWRRVDEAGTEHVVLSDAFAGAGGDQRTTAGLHARGTMICANPVPFTCRYEVYTDNAWATARFDATVEGAGFSRTTRLERAAGRWRVTASEQGDLDAALRSAGHPRAGFPGSEDQDRLARAIDVDLAYSPLTNTLPLRRLGLLDAAAGTEVTVQVAWVLLPSLEVVPNEQTYTRLAGSVVRFTSGTFTADVTVDEAGYVVHYPGLAQRG
jgi:hypothetical protein